MRDGLSMVSCGITHLTTVLSRDSSFTLINQFHSEGTDFVICRKTQFVVIGTFQIVPTVSEISDFPLDLRSMFIAFAPPPQPIKWESIFSTEVSGWSRVGKWTHLLICHWATTQATLWTCCRVNQWAVFPGGAIRGTLTGGTRPIQKDMYKCQLVPGDFFNQSHWKYYFFYMRGQAMSKYTQERVRG